MMSLEENKENLLSFHLHHFIRKNKPLSPFISKLRFLLNCSKHQDAIHWSSDGKSIVITDVETFRKSVLDNEEEMFKTRNFTSFVRQLNLYGFRKVPSNGKSDPSSNMKFEHVHFRRSRPDLMQFVHRTCLSGGGRKRGTERGTSPSPMSSEPRLLPKKTTPILFIKHQNKDSNSKTLTQVHQPAPLKISILQNFKTTTAYQNLPSAFKCHQNSSAKLSIAENTKVVSLPNIVIAREETLVNPVGVDKEIESQEHDYALPQGNIQNQPVVNPVINEIDDEQVYQFLDHTFTDEIQVVQSLLSLPESQPDQSNHDRSANFENLNTLAEVSLNTVDEYCLRSQSCATPCQTANPKK